MAATTAAKAMLSPTKTALLICDMQEKIGKVIFSFDKIVQNSAKLIQACKILKIPMMVTEQNPKGLGQTVSGIDISGASGPYIKTQFSMYTPEVCKDLESIAECKRPKSIILIGIEAHVCVENTVIDLLNNGYEVHTVADCVSSRSQEDRLLALERMRHMGCHIATSENVIFKLLGDSKHKDFKAIQAVIKTPSLETGLVPTTKL